MYDPFAQPQLPQQVQGQTVGMVPGVPGSMGTNPAAGGPVMTPGGGGTGAPVMAGAPSHNNALFGFMQSPQFQAMTSSPQGQAFLQAYPQFQHLLSSGDSNMDWRGGRADHQAMTDWRGARPDRQTYTGNDWQGAISDWRQQRPMRGSYMTPGAVASPAPPAMLPPQPAPTVTDPGQQHSNNPPPTMYPGGGMPGAGIPGSPNGWRAQRGGAGGGYGF